ncbi:DUF2750 domain-containing protein [Biformimicrobium ophioploci]|uniref:DUF2750 domain-containing protein n=1 Tax=Biformimicrobium ophioploci TaxID=3036711 RepID=A0ABQ6M0Z6_9GAMM|nr:DUF2750 domain-containing protein [Microbulbifer sp. NKW57]GMG87976.1 DUF2750 domain-containing protein [Microbulbifer sp. NKW57]
MSNSQENIEPLSEDAEENFARFIADGLDNGVVFTLEGDEGFALCASERSDNADVMPFWSQRAFAEALVADDWADYKVVAIDMEEFVDDWLTGMHDDVIMVGINWTEDLEGLEVEPLDLLETIEANI